MSCLHGNHEDNCDNCDEEIRQWTMGYESQLKELCALKEERDVIKTENLAFKAVMQQALDALIEYHYASTDLAEALGNAAVFALRKAIAQPEQPAAKQNFCPRCGKRLGGTDDIHTCTAPAHLNLSKQTVEKLHRFLDASAGDGVISDGVDAADLYIAIFPEQYAKGAK